MSRNADEWVTACIWVLDRASLFADFENYGEPVPLERIAIDLLKNRDKQYIRLAKKYHKHESVKTHKAWNDYDDPAWEFIWSDGYHNSFKLPKREDLYYIKEAIDEVEGEFKSIRSKKKKTHDTWGFVYLLKSNNGVYKIGHTNDPENRLKTFNVKLPFPVEYECLIETDNMKQLEKELHERFLNRHVNGEWFQLSQEDIEYIKGFQHG